MMPSIVEDLPITSFLNEELEELSSRRMLANNKPTLVKSG